MIIGSQVVSSVSYTSFISLTVFFSPKGNSPAEKAQFRTPISAIGPCDSQIQVFWRDRGGRVACTRYIESCETQFIEGIGPGFGFTVAELLERGRLSLFYEDYSNFLFEYCSGNYGDDWFAGQKLTNTYQLN